MARKSKAKLPRLLETVMTTAEERSSAAIDRVENYFAPPAVWGNLALIFVGLWRTAVRQDSPTAEDAPMHLRSRPATS